MTGKRSDTRIQDLFAAALELEPAQRELFVRNAADGEPDVVQEVLELLGHDARAGEFMATPLATAEIARDASHPARVGNYAIERVLGEGGMGVVYLARQENPNRLVALKVLRATSVAPRALRRFEQETRVLGRLHHPGIAAIHEAGTAETGNGPEPFFAMEFVDGPTIVEYAVRERLGARERLALVALVCDAVQHAHQNGVVHRDLKPANVLIDTSAGRAQPKVLDFGVARATDSDLATATMLTGVGQLVGTVPYMSPEQAAGEREQIGARSDVYTLGVITYELLAGRLPHDFSGKALHEAVRTIRQDDPTPLSRHQPVLRGDVETIVQKALEKDPDRRYASAAEFAADILRFIADEPIAARPPSAIYQFSRFARRNRALVAGVAAVFVALLAGLAGTAWQARVAASERDSARAGWKAEEEARVTALAALDRASRVSAWFQDLLARASPEESGPDTLLVHVLDRAVAELPGSLRGAPDVECEVRTTIGRTYYNLGRFGEAETQFRTALDLGRGSGSESNLAHARGYLGQALLKLDRVDEARELLESAALGLRAAGDHDADRRAEIDGALGLLAYRDGDFERAERLLRSAIRALSRESSARDPVVLSLTISLGLVLSNAGQLEEAEALETNALELAREIRGPRHPDTWSAANNLACTLQRRGEFERALPLFLEADEAGAALQGEDHPETLGRRNNLAGVLERLGRRDEAVELYERILPTLHVRIGPDHVNTLTAESNLALLYSEMRRFDEAEALQRDNLARMRFVLGENDTRTIAAIFNLSWTIGQQLRFEEALVLHEECIRRAEAVMPESSWERWHYVAVFGALLTAMKRLDEAEPALTRSADHLARILGKNHPRTVDTRAAIERCRAGRAAAGG